MYGFTDFNQHLTTRVLWIPNTLAEFYNDNLKSLRRQLSKNIKIDDPF